MCLRSGPFVLRLETLVITENTHSENNDWQKPGGEQSSASETSGQPLTEGAPPNAGEQSSDVETLAQETLYATAATDAMPTVDEGQNEPFAALAFDDQKAQPDAFAQTTTTSDVEQFAPLDDATPSNDEAIRPFTDFIEEFRQTEERFSSLLHESETSAITFTPGSELIQEPVVLAEISAEDLAQVIDTAQTETDQLSTNPFEATSSTLTPPTPSTERPVSPLLRPATRLRSPRYGRHRVEEPTRAAEQPKSLTEQPTEETPASTEPQVEEQPTRPARRYRFDRPAATESASLSTAKVSTPATPVRSAEIKEKRGAQKEQSVSTEPTTARAGAGSSGVALPETPAPKTTSQEATPTSAEASVPAAPASERRRRGNHDRQREKEQAAATVAAPVAPTPEPGVPVVEPAPVSASEIPVEDLPPLEYADLQAANSRRRRRRRIGGVSTPAVANGAISPKVTQPELPVPTPPPSAPAPVLPKIAHAPQSQSANVQPGYNIVSGYTVSQMNQGNDAAGPFMGPEPSAARGSTFGSTNQLRHVRNEALRSTPVHPVKHGESPTMSPASVNHLANVVAQAIQTQTDRMAAELRRANQVPTNVSVSLPPFPSTERVGVFVDVANLLYSARTLRMTIDFGKLLDFLRGNRRLVRAQAYCPTSPQPGDDQMFLQAVKGLGYRITTKNYKTFSSGAKKADLDLDLCMDVVRLVDGRAVDCVVLVSGDSDFMPMLDYCSDHGVRVEIAAFDESMSATLRQACDLFVNLSMLEEIRA
jgi:uncharacterized LabA/DUF88 family protein